MPDAPQFPSYDYLSRPPAWVRNLLTLICGLLVLTGGMGLLGEASETSTGAFDKVDSAIKEPSGSGGSPSAAAAVGGLVETDALSVTFPVKPHVETEMRNVDGRSLEKTTYKVEGRNIAYLVATMAFDDMVIDFNEAAQGAANAVDGDVESATATTVDGHPAMDVKISLDGGTMRIMILTTPTHLIQIMVAGDGDPAAQYQAFLKTVTIR